MQRRVGDLWLGVVEYHLQFSDEALPILAGVNRVDEEGNVFLSGVERVTSGSALRVQRWKAAPVALVGS